MTIFFARFSAALLFSFAGIVSHALALDLRVADPAAQPLATVMVTVGPASAAASDRSDNGYAKPGVVQPTDLLQTVFTNAAGQVHVDLGERTGPWTVRLRKPGYVDASMQLTDTTQHVAATLQEERDPMRLAEAKPANTWAAGFDLGTPELTRNFRVQCSFCHQQGGAAMRPDRTDEAWNTTIERMIRYGSRLSTDAQRAAPARLRTFYHERLAHPEKIPDPRPWDASLANVRMDEWPLGDLMSQMHDMLVHENGFVYVGDNAQDRLYEVNPRTNEFTVYKMPREPGDELGGLFAARMAAFPKHETYLSLHSLAASEKDGHIFITPSTQRRIIEFDPQTKAFTVHRLKDGLYPHTIRIDRQDRVWFTLALSNQVGMINRATGEQHFVDLPARSLGEALTIRAVPLMFELAKHGVPISSWHIDDRSSGTPLVYGIDITPDGTVWVARLHADDIARIDPVTLEPEMISFPGHGPRRLRSDAEGNLWITAFGDSSVVRYDPRAKRFDSFPMPTLPAGSDTPYSLNVDRMRGIVWVTGTGSDTVNAFNIATQSWSVFPLPRRLFFTRDIEIDEDGSIYSSNGAFPAWLIEGAQPTLVRVTPPWADARKSAVKP